MTTFLQYYKNLRARPRPLTTAQQFIQDLMIVTGKTEKTVRQWVYGCQQPSEEDKDIISRMLQIPTTELFPKNKQRWKT